MSSASYLYIPLQLVMLNYLLLCANVASVIFTYQESFIQRAHFHFLLLPSRVSLPSTLALKAARLCYGYLQPCSLASMLMWSCLCSCAPYFPSMRNITSIYVWLTSPFVLVGALDPSEPGGVCSCKSALWRTGHFSRAVRLSRSWESYAAVQKMNCMH